LSVASLVSGGGIGGLGGLALLEVVAFPACLGCILKTFRRGNVPPVGLVGEP